MTETVPAAGRILLVEDESALAESVSYNLSREGFDVVAAADVDAVRQYIRGQEEHHRGQTYEEEFIALLERHGVEYDRRYLWG